MLTNMNAKQTYSSEYWCRMKSETCTVFEDVVFEAAHENSEANAQASMSYEYKTKLISFHM